MTDSPQQISPSNVKQHTGSVSPISPSTAPYTGLPWRIVVMFGDSNKVGVPSGFDALDPLIYPRPMSRRAFIYDRAGQSQDDVLHRNDGEYFIRPLTPGYGGGNVAPWLNGGDGIGPELGMAASLDDEKGINTLVIKLGLGGSFVFLDEGAWNWNAAMEGPNAALIRLYHEHYLAAKAILMESLGGDSSPLLQTCIVSLVGGNDMHASRSPEYRANMVEAINYLRTAINPSAPTDVPWGLVKQPLYESPPGTSFADIESIRKDQDSLHDPENGITTIDIGQPTPGASYLHWDAAGTYSAGAVIGKWLKSVAP